MQTTYTCHVYGWTSNVLVISRFEIEYTTREISKSQNVQSMLSAYSYKKTYKYAQHKQLMEKGYELFHLTYIL